MPDATQENSFSSKMLNKSEAQLKEYLGDNARFQEGAIRAAIWELEKRGLVDDESREAIRKIEYDRVTGRKRNSEEQIQDHITDDPNAPLLYRDKFIVFFGVLFSVLAGGILLAINLSKIGKRNLVVPVIAASIAYLLMQVYLLNLLNSYSNLVAIPVTILGVLLLENLFWKRNVTKDLKYRKRPVWGAVVVALIISSPIIYLSILSLQYQ